MTKSQCDCQHWPYKLPEGSLDILLTGHHDECPDKTLTRFDGALQLIQELVKEDNVTARSKAKCITEILTKASKASSSHEPQEKPAPKSTTTTLEQAKSLYMAVADPPYDFDDYEWKDIHEEIEAIITAPGPKIAAKVIEWWEVWDKKNTAVGFAKHVRALAAEQGIGSR